jgi:hypothetical protein
MAPRRAGRGVAGLSTQLWLAPPGQKPDKPPTSVSLSDQGLVQPLQGFMTNPAGAAVVNAIRPIRQLVRGEDKAPRRYLVIAPGTVGNLGAPAQVQAE